MRTLFFTLLLCFNLFSLNGQDNDHSDTEQNPKKSTICLNMIVKDEKDVIERCLASTLPTIDYWVIVDTGSKDGTQQIIKDYMQRQNVPGQLFERPWVDFAHNRNEAIDLAKGKADYLLFMDADEYLEFADDYKRPSYDKDCYYGEFSHSGTKYERVKLITTQGDIKYFGVLHEAIHIPQDASVGNLEKIICVATAEGARSKDPEKYLKDAKVLEKALEADPDNTRYIYYLGQSYLDADEYELALKQFQRRVLYPGWDEEKFVAGVNLALMQDYLDMPKETVIESYQKAHMFRPWRVEPLYYLASYYKDLGEYELGYQAAKKGLSTWKSNDKLFVQQWMHDYALAVECAICALATERYDECLQLCLGLMLNPKLPADVRPAIDMNLKILDVILNDAKNSKD